MRQRTQQTTGLTLIEVLVALAMFTVVAAAVLGLFPTVFKVNGATRADQAVTIGAKRFMEQTRAAMDTRTEFDAMTTTTLPAVPEASKVNNYTCVKALNDHPAPGTAAGVLKRVTLTCTHATYPEQVFSLDLGRP